MSELTPCNFCSLQRKTERATESGTHVVLRAGEGAMAGWIGARLADGSGEESWFLELTDRCVC